jgi:hypothetical protein
MARANGPADGKNGMLDFADEQSDHVHDGGEDFGEEYMYEALEHESQESLVSTE